MSSIPNVYEWHVLDDLPGTWDKAINYAIAHDSEGYIYVAGYAFREIDSTTLVYLQKFAPDGNRVASSNGTLPWYSALNEITSNNPWEKLIPQCLLVDEVNLRLYRLVRATMYQAPGSYHFFLNAHDLRTGEKYWGQSLGQRPSYEEKGCLDLDGVGNIWAAITEDTSHYIKVVKFSLDGTRSPLVNDGLLYTDKQRHFFAFGSRKKDNSLYFAYREYEHGNPVDDLVIARYDHELKFLGRSPYKLEFEPHDDPNTVIEETQPDFHDGFVDVQDRFVLGGYFTCVKDITYPESFGKKRFHYPLVFGFNTDGSECFRYVDTSVDSYEVSVWPVNSLREMIAQSLRAVVKPGEGTEVLYSISTFSRTICIRDDGKRADQNFLNYEYLNLDETIGQYNYEVYPYGLDFTALLALR